MKKPLLLLSLFAALTAHAVDTAYTRPVGGMNFSISGGSIAAPVTTRFALPLLDTAAASGMTIGRITSVTSSTFTVTSAGWVDSALASTAYPYAVRFLSGSGEGMTLSVTANTTDTITISGRDLVQLGVQAGDGFRLIPIDTLNSLFGSTTFLGGPDARNADIITLSSSSSFSFYYNTTLNRWVRTTGPTTDRGNVPIPPDSVIAITRKSTALELQFIGMPPDTKHNKMVANSGSTFTHTGFPTDTTLGGLALQTRIPGWVSGATAATADTLAVNSGGTWLTYFHNGTYWQRTTGPATNRDSIVISAGAAIQIFKRGSASGFSDFTRPLPYSI